MTTEATVGTAVEERIPLGIAYACLGMFCVAGLDTLAKLLGEGYGVVQIMFFRNFFGLFLIAALVWRDGGMRTLRTAQPVQHAIRGACALAAGLMFFTGLQFMPLAEAFAITFAGPVFIAALSVPLLGEKVGPRRWAAILVGFAAVLAILRPGSAAFQLAALLPLGAAFAYALVMIFSRRLSRGEARAMLLARLRAGAVQQHGVAAIRQAVEPRRRWLRLDGIVDGDEHDAVVTGHARQVLLHVTVVVDASSASTSIVAT